MSVLITGGAGFIGASLAVKLLERGETVIIFDRVLNESLEAGKGKLVQIKGDIGNWSEVLTAVKDHRVDTIFHLAAMLSALCEANPMAAVNANGFGTYFILEAARLFGVRKLVFTSSMGVYNVTQDTVVDEDTIQRPSIMYGVTKVFGELLGLYYQRKFGIDFRGLRFPQLIGPGVKTPGFGQYNPRLIEAAITGEAFDVWVTEDTVIPLMYIKDAIRALIMIYDAPEEKLLARVYNLGQIMPAPTARELLDEVKRYYPDARIGFKPDPNAAAVIRSIPRFIRGDRAEAEWGWQIGYSLKDTVKDFIEEFGKTRR